ncbi:ribonuclease HI [Saccharicrinis sp. GN24d3]
MDEIILLTDGSYHPQSHIGYGAYLAIYQPYTCLNTLKEHVNVRRFENTSSTKLELQTLLWALTEIEPEGAKVIIYTDSQNIIGLPGRRQRLERNNYLNKKGELIKNHDLYQEFYSITDVLDCDFIKIKGHKTENAKTEIDKLFTLVDRTSRKALRENRL